jgi:hypothetical protein
MKKNKEKKRTPLSLVKVRSQSPLIKQDTLPGF